MTAFWDLEQLMDAENTGRICYGTELTPGSGKVIVSRYVKYTGNRNIRLDNNDKFKWNFLTYKSIDLSLHDNLLFTKELRFAIFGGNDGSDL